MPCALRTVNYSARNTLEGEVDVYGKDIQWLGLDLAVLQKIVTHC